MSYHMMTVFDFSLEVAVVHDHFSIKAIVFLVGSLANCISLGYISGADPGFANGGRNITSAWSASLYGGVGVPPPAGSRDRAPGGGQPVRRLRPLKLKSFGVFQIQTSD
jgi:hypothetical protein